MFLFRCFRFLLGRLGFVSAGISNFLFLYSFFGSQFSLLAFWLFSLVPFYQKKKKANAARVLVGKLVSESCRGIRLSWPLSASCDADIPSSSSRNRIASPEAPALAPSSLIFAPSLFQLHSSLCFLGSAMLCKPSSVPPQFVLQVREGYANSEGKGTCGSSLFYSRQPPKMKASRTPLCLISTPFFIKKMFPPLFFKEISTSSLVNCHNHLLKSSNKT